MTQVITASKEMERQAQDNATEKMLTLSKPLGPSISGAMAQIEQEKELKEDEERLVEEGEAIDFSKCTIREVQVLNPVPEQLDPFTEALIGGVDPVAVHQALTLSYPILAFLGHNARVLYADGMLRWICGQSWQMGGSGTGKSQVLRSLENLFLSKELAEKNVAAKKEADYSLLTEEESKKTAKPQEKLRILDAVPSAIAMLEQMQINGDGLMYLSCTEGGEFTKKISSQYYSIVLDIMKKSYDGTGEAFLHKTKEKTYFVPSMKLCCNIGGTIDPMYKIFRHCDSDGTLSRGTLVILGERKDEKKEGAYKRPQWTKEQTAVLLEGARRLKTFNNTFKEDENICDEESLERAYEGAKDSDGNAPTFEEYNFSVQEERERLALSVPAIIALGKEIKANLARIGEIADDCCSRANERAMAMCYLLYIANGLADVPEEERDAQYNETLQRIIDVVRWWVNCSIDCALAVQRQLNANSRSYREEIRLAYKEAMGATVAQNIYKERQAAFEQYEKAHSGEIVNVRTVRDSCDAFKRLSLRTILRSIQERGWDECLRGKYRVPGKEVTS